MNAESRRRLNIICECGCGLPATLPAEMEGAQGHYDHALGLHDYPGRYHQPTAHQVRTYLRLCGDSRRAALAYLDQHEGVSHTEPYVPGPVKTWLAGQDEATLQRLRDELRSVAVPVHHLEYVQ